MYFEQQNKRNKKFIRLRPVEIPLVAEAALEGSLGVHR